MEIKVNKTNRIRESFSVFIMVILNTKVILYLSIDISNRIGLYY